MKQNKTLIWLDDVRDPNKNDWLVFSPISDYEEVVWLKTYEEFTEWIINNGLPIGICFDHDLSDFQAFYNGYPDRFKEDYVEGVKLGKKEKWDDILAKEKTGYDCAKWLVEYCMDSNQPLPKWNVQSANEVGKENINRYLNNYRKNESYK
jgi:hypothetical protein